jgi:hypothetical protein
MKIQIARAIYLEQVAIMKKLLDLMAFKMDMRTNDYKYVKAQIMDYFYEGLKLLYIKLEQEEIIEKCSCGTNVRKGYKKCECGGSGYINKKDKTIK